MQTPGNLQQNSVYTRRGRRTFFWNGLLSVLLLWWGFRVLRSPWGSLKPETLSGAAVAFAVWGFCSIADRMSGKWQRWLLWLLPWVALIPWAGEIRQGLLLWLNCVLTLWNREHESALVLFQTTATAESVKACSIAVAVALAQLIERITARRQLLLCGIAGLALALLQLLTGTFVPAVWGLWFSAFLGLWMGEGQVPPRQVVRIWMLGAVVCLLCAWPGAEETLSPVTRLRMETEQAVQRLRYGSDPLPAGELSEAAKLNHGKKEIMQVSTEQEKSLYLRAFVGAEYADGRWTSLPASAYGGVYSGMLSWLRKQGFDPLTQAASYYALSDLDTAPEENTLSIQVSGGTRSYLYLPATTDDVSASHKERRDERMTPRGLRGADSYLVTEYSADRPAELTVWADWVAEPETAEQEQYVQAEKLYRSFVYDQYTRTDAALLPTIEKLFWENYKTENDGVYSALDHIRTVLNRQTVYTRTPEAAEKGADALQEFLNGSRAGNAVLYASAAVEALRARGIPARYVEGYYISASEVAESGNGVVSLTGQNAHAWAEVYFDGVGWLPVDVTPGYYYDAVTLRQMISLPDTVKKTAALEEDSGGGEEVTTDNEVSKRPGVLETVRDTTFVLFGVGSIAVVLLTIWFAGGRFWRLFQEERKKRQYLRADTGERTRLLKRWLYAALAKRGIDTCLGWKTAETDSLVAESFAEAEPGDYTRAVELLEKAQYGGAELELFELRVLENFLRKVTVGK